MRKRPRKTEKRRGRDERYRRSRIRLQDQSAAGRRAGVCDHRAARRAHRDGAQEQQRSSDPASSADLTVLQAEANALRNEYNNQRIAMGLRPIEGSSEPIEEIAGRVKKDADTLVALAGSYQKLLSEKDNELTARNAEILRSEKLRAALTADNTRLQADLQRALVGAPTSIFSAAI